MNMADTGDAEKAIEALNGGEVDGRAIKVERARRATGYEKTPGRLVVLQCPVYKGTYCTLNFVMSFDEYAYITIMQRKS